jgi:LCP family protein required for cell wall assembly
MLFIMSRKLFIFLCSLIFIIFAAYLAFDFFDLGNIRKAKNEILSPLAKKAATKSFDTELATKDYINILLLGIDRRSKNEYGYRTDTMILVSINKRDNMVVLTSVPRDLWYANGRINALYLTDGFEGLQEAYEEITGIRPQRYILTDFEDFSWIVDAMGGIDVDVQTSFTDTGYPVDETFEYQTVTFEKGLEKMTGERALIFSRSRKGDYDNGDWGRMRRQHLLLKSMLSAITNPTSFVCTISLSTNDNTDCELKVDAEVIAKSLATVTGGRMTTNLQVQDLVYLWDFYKYRDQYQISSLLMDDDFVYSPPMSDYGGAWVLAPIGNDYTRFHAALQRQLHKPIITPTSPEIVNEGQ